MKQLAPSILSADFSKLAEDVAQVEKGGADYIHVDVMDGHFVPNISYGAVVMKSLEGKTDLPFDVHLMIENPDDYLEDFMTPNTEYITVHQEACPHLHRTVQHIKSLGVKAGVSINPATSLATLDYILDDVDMVLVMSVNPGFGGQKFIENTIDKVKRLRKLIADTGSHALIEVDGGVQAETAPRLVAAGVDVLVSGSYVFKAADPLKTIRELKNT